MYKCTECGLEFDVKPEYCDCGNDEFVLTVEEKHTGENFSENVTSTVETRNCENKYTDDISIINNKSKKFELPVHPAALAVFIFCLILSGIILFVWNPIKIAEETVKDIKEMTVQKQIPSIDKLWKEPVIKNEVVVEQKNIAMQEQVKTPVQISSNKVTTVKKTASSNNKPAKVSKPQTNTQPSKKIINNQTTLNQTVIDTAAKKAEEDAKKAQEAKQKVEAEALAAAERARKTALAKQELSKYKINLRNTIGQKIDFTKVIGDGECAVSFKLDSGGKLINRVFVKQSSNITLNNAVYNAIMLVPMYSAPPSGYKNETLTLNVSFNNGNFAITLE